MLGSRSCPRQDCKTTTLAYLRSIALTNNGTYSQKYSLYIPVHEKSSSKSHRKSSASKDADSRTAKEREKAARADALAKRRSTMNSRSAYDEEEVLRAVLEQSKKDGGLGSESNTRKGKRGRDDSDEYVMVLLPSFRGQ